MLGQKKNNPLFAAETAAEIMADTERVRTGQPAAGTAADAGFAQMRKTAEPATDVPESAASVATQEIAESPANARESHTGARRPAAERRAAFPEPPASAPEPPAPPSAPTPAPHVSPSPVYDEEPPARRIIAARPNPGTAARALFFEPEDDSRDFASVLADVQAYISAEHAGLITEGAGDAKEHIKRYISKYLQDHRVAVKGLPGETLAEALYSEMAEFGFLTKYVFGQGIEEINVNSWRDVEVVYADGRMEKLTERFDSPDHAVNVVRRMLHVSGVVLDNASPAVLGHLSKNIRVAVLKTPLVDEDVGVSASIRIVNPRSMTQADFVNGGVATDEMMDFLALCLRYGVSVCVAGATGSGKTTLAGWLLTTIPHNKRIFTIENGSRELDLARYEDGRSVNSVVHTLTRESENEKQNIDQDALLDMALRFHPDVICVGEMRSAEAYTAQEAARTGHAVLSTVHSNSCEATWRRIVTLCKRKHDMGDDTLMDLVTEAFPIIVFAKQLESRERRIMEIMECERLPDGTRRNNTLYRYAITENRQSDGRFVVKGHHERAAPISEGLKKRLVENGAPQSALDGLGRTQTPRPR